MCKTSIIKSDGVKLFNLSISSSNVVREKFVDVYHCYKCYAINDHTAKDCTKPVDYVVCSLCTATSHKYDKCGSVTNKCINCGGDHSTLAFSCPNRKQVVKELLNGKVSNSKFPKS